MEGQIPIKKCSIKINDIIANNDIVDIYRMNHPSSKRYTWHSNHKPPIFCRLDYFLISTNLLNLVTQSNIIPDFLSDHSVITLDINLSEAVRGPGHFKINNSILLNEDYKANINSAIQEIVEINKDCNPNILWELIKGYIRNESIRYSSNLKKKQREKEYNIILEIKKNRRKNIR